MPEPIAPNPAPVPSPPPPAPAPAPSPFSSLADKAKTITPKAPIVPDPDAGKGGDQPPVPDPSKGTPDPDAGKGAKEPKWYREQITSKGAELDKASRKVSELEQKISSYEARGMDTTALTAQLTAREKALEAAQAELSAVKYERSDEYKKKYDQPFRDAAEYAKTVVENLTVKEGDDSERPARWDTDFSNIYSMPPGRAEMEAQRIFGAGASIVLRQLDKLRDLDHSRKQALRDHEAGANEREKAARASAVQQADKINRAWQMAEKDLLERNPDYFGEKPGEDERNSIWKESLQLVDQAYTGRDKLTDSERVVLDANVRLQAAAYPVLVREVAHLRHTLDEYKVRLGEKEASKPGGKGKPADARASTPKDWKDELRAANVITP